MIILCKYDRWHWPEIEVQQLFDNDPLLHLVCSKTEIIKNIMRFLKIISTYSFVYIYTKSGKIWIIRNFSVWMSSICQLNFISKFQGDFWDTLYNDKTKIERNILPLICPLVPCRGQLPMLVACVQYEPAKRKLNLFIK